MKNKYQTEEKKISRKEYLKEYGKQWRKKHSEYLKEYGKQWRKKHSEYRKEYYKKHLDEEKDRMKLYYKENYENIKEYIKKYITEKYYNTQYGRALYLIGAYKRADKNMGRKKGDLSPQWIVENIFSQPCHYCGETDWRKMGCDRIDNSLPHTPDNVVPCCAECNRKRGTKDYEEFKKSIL